ncbi:diguanylate cyclase domain-containing protein [Tepidibacter hydrothermalis]|uniref:Diguanylate cyclase n=1 Tax=Tepidibacter hydrothermalis TaxID=3036126 RepID=A0ABY8EDB9_9FIRM|nr:diguanylate cyclase [Tepidibacter hydrothermalis]WFD10938.1 diguanylate cyclase [Tepidibacter hydrothermalis]
MNMNSFIAKKKYILKYSIILFITLSLIFISLSSIFQYNIMNLKKQEIEKNENRIVRLEKDILREQIDNVISDLLFLSDSLDLYSLDESTYQDIAKQWKVFSDRKKIYDQIRYIDLSGNEIIRINYSDKGSHIINKSELKNKKERYYFKDSISLKRKQIYISKLDLNVEDGKVEQPLKSMMRLSTPVFDNEGNVKGIVILNYYAKYLLDDFGAISQNSVGEAYLLDSNGYWIYNKDKDKEWAFMYEEKKEISFKNEYPKEWSYILDNEEGTLNTKNGFYTFSNIMQIDTDSSKNKKLENIDIVFGEGNWTVVLFIPKDSECGVLFENDPFELLLNVLSNGKIVLLIILIISILFSVLMTMNKISKEKIKYFSEYDEMTGVLNRRAGLQNLNKQYTDIVNNGGGISICFIDINGLKDVNDALGHEAGDELIMTVVKGIKKHIKKSDFVIRMGGDEFLVIFVNLDIEEAENVWERINNEYKKINDEENRAYIVSVSHGIEECKFHHNEYIDSIINSADQKMYNEKREIKKGLTIVRKKQD